MVIFDIFPNSSRLKTKSRVVLRSATVTTDIDRYKNRNPVFGDLYGSIGANK